MLQTHKGKMPKQEDYLEKVTEEDFREYGIIGSPEEVTDRILHMYKLGVDRFIWGFALIPDPKKSMHLLGKQVIPNLPPQE